MNSHPAPAIGIRTSLTRLAALALAGAAFAANPFADDGDYKPPKTVIELMGDLHKQPLLWRKEWMTDDAGGKTKAAEIVLKIATEKSLTRKAVKSQLDQAPPDFKPATKNLDVGRHQLVKWLMAEAYKETNRRLGTAKLMPLDRATTVNSGGTGDYTRDVDMTVFAGDEVRERTYFESIRDLARKAGLNVETGPGDSVQFGINLPEIEVALHRGNNDLPDPRFATDVKTFALDYRKAIEGQARNPEAYFGYGFEVEVQGRRYLSFKPGQTLLQTFETEGGKPKYTAQVASCNREVRAVLRGAIGGRYRRAQNCVHAVNDYLQAFRHEQHEGGDPSKGALKYAGRAVEMLCDYHGFKNWSELMLEDRIQLLARVMPKGYLDEPGGRGRLERMTKSMDVAYLTFLGKKTPKEAAGEGVDDAAVAQHAQVALILLRKAAAATVSAVAQEMLDPPALSPRFLAEMNQHDSKWQEMSPAERDAVARQRDENYRQCVSVAAMENLLATVEQIRVLDLPEFNKGGSKPGEQATKEMLAAAEPHLRPLIEIAVAHADAAVRLQHAKTPEERTRAQADLANVRTRMEDHLHKPSPGKQTLAAARELSPQEYVRGRKAGKSVPAAEGVEETRQRMKKFVEDSLGDEVATGARARIAQIGLKGYVKERLAEEAFQLGNISDALTLVEMYQGGASASDYTFFVTTNLLGRCHWGMGFLIQAVQVKNEEDLKSLGKNIVFDAFSRVIPGLAQAKVIFDIEKGLVMVTFGYMINQSNADLIDALYTGEAGRLNDGTAGKAAGRIRDSGVCVLEPAVVVKEKDPQGNPRIAVNQQLLYQSLFKQWFGPSLRYDEINVRSPLGGDKGKLLAAHDRLAKAILAIGTDKETPWFGKSTNYVDPNEISAAADAFVQIAGPLLRAKVQGVLDELAVREYKVDGKDVIAEGLFQRTVGDVTGGLVTTWQTQRVEQMMAKREIEYSAKLGDLRALAQGLADAPDDGTLPKADIELIEKTNVALGAPGSLPLNCRLRFDRPLPPSIKDVKLEIEPLPFTILEEAPPEHLLRVVKQPFKARAIANDGAGPVLGEKTFELKVNVMPGPEQVLTKANSCNFHVYGNVRRVIKGGWNPADADRTFGSSIDIRFTAEPGAPLFQWSGDRFSYEGKSENGAGTRDSTKYTYKIRVTGSLNRGLAAVSWVADYDEVQTSADETTTDVKTIRRHIEATDVPYESLWLSSLVPNATGDFHPYVNYGSRVPKGVQYHRVSAKSNEVDRRTRVDSEGTKVTESETSEVLVGDSSEPNYRSGASASFTAPRAAFQGRTSGK